MWRRQPTVAEGKHFEHLEEAKQAMWKMNHEYFAYCRKLKRRYHMHKIDRKEYEENVLKARLLINEIFKRNIKEQKDVNHYLRMAEFFDLMLEGLRSLPLKKPRR